jgi:hypothetical protein
MKKIYMLILLAFSVSNIFSQTFYQKTIALTKKPNTWNGGTPYLAKQTADKGIIFTGSYYNNGISDSSTFLTKLDANLAVQWSVGLYSAQDPQPYALLQTKDLGFLIAGTANEIGGGSKVFVAKLNKNGKSLWEVHLKRATYTAAYSAQEDKAGNIFVSGKSDNGTESYLWVTKLSRTGTISLDTVYAITGNNVYENKILSSKDNGFVVIGNAGGNSFVMKADTLGKPLWTKIIGEQFQPYDMDLSEASNRDVTIAATKTDGSVITFQLNKDGNLKWSKSLTNTGAVTANDLLQLTSGNLFLSTTVAGSPNKIDVLKIDTTGTVLSAKNLKTTDGNIFNYINKISETEYSLSGWDASSGTDYLSLDNFDSSLQNCTDVSASYTVSDYSLANSNGTTTTFGSMPTLATTITGSPWTNSSTVTAVCELVLPLNLLNFTLTKSGSSNLLKWSTSQEINTSSFEIQRSADGRTFAAIGNVNAGRKSTQNDYQFTDANPLGGTNYYRLKIIDADGKFAYSPIVWASNVNIASIVIYPIPIKDKITMKLNSVTENVYNVIVTDVQGHVVLRTTFSVDAGTTVKEINATSLKQGTYFVKIESTSGSQVIKIVK